MGLRYANLLRIIIRSMVRAPSNKGRRFPVEILTPDEVRRLLAAITQHTSVGLRNRALIVVMYRAGLRHSEALDLYPKDVDVDLGAISVLSGKNRKRRTAGIDPGAIAILDEWMEKREELGFGPHEYLFCSMRGRTLSSSYMRGLLPRLGREAGIAKRVHPHGLRHTMAFELMMEKIPLKVIQQQLGHSNLATTDIYLSHIAPADVIEAIGEREWSP